MGDVLSCRWRAGAGIACVLALAGCEGVPGLTFAGADASESGSGSSDAGGSDSLIDASAIDASDGDDGSSDADASDSQVDASVIDASGCQSDGGGQPPPNSVCCGSVPCSGSYCLANCSRCMMCTMPGALCCAKQPNNVTCRYLNAPPPCM
jgi:hypothetical protein